MKPEELKVVQRIAFVISLVFLGSILSISPPVWGATTGLNPTKDSYLDENQPDQNYGTSGLLYVKSHFVENPSQHHNRRIVLQFDLTSIPESCAVQRATLELYMAGPPVEGRNYELYSASEDTWNENEVTWDTQPVRGTLLDTVFSGQNVGVVTWGYPNLGEQLTPAVSSAHTSNKIISFAIKDQSEDSTPGATQAVFTSKENTPKPVLKVEYECAAQEGCSHTYWKNHPFLWADYVSDDLLKNVFQIPEGYIYSESSENSTISYHIGDKTLMEGLEFPAGDGAVGAAMILLRSAVAALLNAVDPEVSYSLTNAEVLTSVNNALLSGDSQTMLALKEQLDALNNLGCPLRDLPPFADVPSGYWAYNFIMGIYYAGITGGCSADPLLFCPANVITRGQMAVFIEASLGVTGIPPCTGTVFNDVNAATVGSAFCGFIEDFYARGITAGCGGGNYCPNAPVPRWQMAVFIEAALGRIPDQLPSACSGMFNDVNASTVGDYVCTIIEDFGLQGITGGCGGGNFCPFDPVTRAQMAVFLVAAPPPLNP